MDMHLPVRCGLQTGVSFSGRSSSMSAFVFRVIIAFGASYDADALCELPCRSDALSALTVGAEGRADED
jgi:hypothetical protein